MKQEFVYSEGKIFIERDVLYIRNLTLRFSRSLAGNLLLPVCWTLFFLLNFLEEDRAKMYTRMLLLGFMLVFQLPVLYAIIFRRSYAHRIPLKKIVSIEIAQDNIGLETYVRLRLKSGRTRQIPFRNLEDQVQPFTEFLSRYIVQPQLA